VLRGGHVRRDGDLFSQAREGESPSRNRRSKGKVAESSEENQREGEVESRIEASHRIKEAPK